MKKLLPLIALITLVSCNDSLRSRSTISNNSNTVDRYSSGLSTKRGTVAYIKKQGSELAIDFTKSSDMLATTPVNIRTTSIIINVDGNKAYKHLTIENLITKETTKKIVLEIENTHQELKEILDSGKGKVAGDNLLLQFSEEYPSSGDPELEIIKKSSFNATVNLWMPHCDSKTQITSSGTLIINGEVNSTKKFQTTEISTCEKSYSDKQLRALSLSSIEFCSYPNGEEEQCESDRDMSFLTSDL